MKKHTLSNTLITVLLVLGLALCLPLAAQAQGRKAEERRTVSARETGEEKAPKEDLGPAPKLDLNETSPAVPVLGIVELRELLGKDPGFVFDHKGKRDPMMLPWVYFRLMAEKQLAFAERALRLGNLDLAEQAFRAVQEVAGAMERRAFQVKKMLTLLQRAEAGLREIKDERQEKHEQDVAKGKIAELPAWIERDTNGIVFAESGPMCILGPYVLGVGDLVPEQAELEVRVERIEPRAVIYRVKDKTFPVKLEEGEQLPP